MRKNERYERFLSSLKEEEEPFLFRVLVGAESLRQFSEQTDDKILKRISRVKRKLSLRKTTREYIIKVFSRNQRERRREIERAVLASRVVKRSKEGFGLSHHHHLVANLSEASPIQLKEQRKEKNTRLRRRRVYY